MADAPRSRPVARPPIPTTHNGTTRRVSRGHKPSEAESELLMVNRIVNTITASVRAEPSNLPINLKMENSTSSGPPEKEIY